MCFWFFSYSRLGGHLKYQREAGAERRQHYQGEAQRFLVFPHDVPAKLYFAHTNCTSTSCACRRTEILFIVLRYRLPYTYWGGIWDLLTFNVAILSTLLLYRLWRGALKATYFPFDLFSRISERLLLLKLHIGKWLLLKIKDVNTSLAKSGFWDFYWNSFFFVACKKRICVCFNKWPKSSLVPQPTCCWKSKSDGDPIYPTQALKVNPDSKKLYEVRFFPLLYSCFY